MGLPAWNAEGYLPDGIHRASMDDIYERFVLDAPERDHRETLFSAFQTYYRLVKRFLPSGAMWVDGGFGTRKATAPHDVDVVLHPSDWAQLEALDDQAETDFLGLLTHQDIIVGSLGPIWLPRLQPVGGALDSFLCYPGQEPMWMETWSSVKGDDGLIVDGASKGFAEVVW